MTSNCQVAQAMVQAVPSSIMPDGSKNSIWVCMQKFTLQRYIDWWFSSLNWWHCGTSGPPKLFTTIGSMENHDFISSWSRVVAVCLCVRKIAWWSASPSDSYQWENCTVILVVMRSLCHMASLLTMCKACNCNCCSVRAPIVEFLMFSVQLLQI